MNSPLILQIAIPGPFRRLFDYLPLANHQASNLQPGIRIKVPFGKSNPIGILVSTQNQSEMPINKLKRVSAYLDTTPYFSKQHLDWLLWVSSYYHHPIGMTLTHVFPSHLRKDKKNKPTQNFYWEVSTLGKGIALETLNRAPKQKVLLQFLSEQNQATKQAMLDDKFVNWRPTMRALEKKAFVEKKNLVVPPLLPQRESAPKVNREQKAAIDKISNKINQFAIFLLDGITGSGKTEVYLNSIVNVINNDQQVLILIPEISLTPQLLQRFESRFGGGIATLHSGMNDSERYDIWLKAKNAQVNILIGTRSAIFTPMPKLGMIIIDEEHDLSYKQQTGLRYSARDIALTRAQRLKIPIVLGSATPSFESLLNVKRGIFQELRLSKRAGKSKPPIIKTLNIKGQKLQENFSVQLLQLIDKHLMRNEQVMIFLNRRGYAPTLICQECGWVGMCNRCDHPMTIHEYKQRIICHHCGSERRTPAQCPECSSIDLRPRGYGTERIEQVLRRFFPTTEILRIDRDTTSRKNALHQLLNKVKIDQAQILLGTQMLAKGHDFPNVTLVGILDTDQGLFGVDLRASERMAQLITQVAGRAGRGKKAGKVVIQTQHPDHPLLTSLIEQGYRQFAQTALQERKQARMPPYTYAALLRATSTAVKFNIQFLTDIKQTLLQLRSDDLEILGPAPSPMERMAGQYRTQLLLVSENRKSLHGALDYLLQRIDSFDSVKRVKWSLDIDPQEMS